MIIKNEYLDFLLNFISHLEYDKYKDCLDENLSSMFYIQDMHQQDIKSLISKKENGFNLIVNKDSNSLYAGFEKLYKNYKVNNLSLFWGQGGFKIGDNEYLLLLKELNFEKIENTFHISYKNIKSKINLVALMPYPIDSKGFNKFKNIFDRNKISIIDNDLYGLIISEFKNIYSGDVYLYEKLQLNDKKGFFLAEKDSFNLNLKF